MKQTMKRTTRQKRGRVVNDVLYYCYAHIDAPIRLNDLAEEQGISPFHLHRIFREETGETLQESLRSIRLQKAANLLLTNRHATISEISGECGYASHTSFIKAFRIKFGQAPMQWRKGGFRQYADGILKGSQSASDSEVEFEGLIPDIRRIDARRVAYLRHRGYNRTIRETWQRLLAWCHEEGVKQSAMQIGLHHDNPLITPLESCMYVACVELDSPENATRSIGELVIPGGLHAVFSVRGRYGDVLKLLQYVYHVWLPESGYEAKVLPAYTCYRRNHFIDASGIFELDLFVPVRVL